MIDALVSADLVVDDVDQTAQRLVQVLGLPQPAPAWVHDFPGYTYKAVFCRVHPDLGVDPTLIEVIGAAAADGSPPPGMPRVDENLRAYAALQGVARPVKTHGTVLSTDDLPAVLDRLRRTETPHRVERPTPELPFDRVWIGTTPSNPHDYEPSADGGLFLEIVPTTALRLPRARPLVAPPPGTMVRVVSRRFLVEDLDLTVERLGAVIGWPSRSHPSDGEHGRSLRVQPRIPHSAALELVQPARGRLADFFAEHGPGPHAICIGTVDLDAKVTDLGVRGYACSRVGEHAVEVDPTALGGVIVELCEVGEDDPSVADTCPY